MNATEPKNAFLLMRANGWSLRSISKELGVPKSTLFNWESDPPTRRAINVMKSLQLEKLQERYIPSFEEELQKLSTCLSRVEHALEKQDFEAMRPEFLLRTSLQLRSRLNKLRSDVQPTRTLDHGELPPNPLPGCISRSRSVALDTDDSSPAPKAAVTADQNGHSEFVVPASAGRAGNLRQSPEPRQSLGNADGGDEVLQPFWDKNEDSSKPEPTAPATCTNENGTTVPTSQPSDSPPSPLPSEERVGERRPDFQPASNTDPGTPAHAHERYGDLATPLSKIPLWGSGGEISLTAGFHPPCTPESARPCVPSRSISSPPQKPCAATRAQASKDSLRRP